MNFSILSYRHKKWLDVLVIGKTIERDGKKYHIIGMTLSDEAKLYIIEPYDKQELTTRKGIRSHRQILKEHEERSCSYLHCSDFHLGSERLQIQGGNGGALEYSLDDYGDKVQCYINNVTLIDVWKNTEEEFSNPKLAEKFSPEQLEEAIKHRYDALEQCCPKGMFYIGVEYECSKNYNLIFHSKQYLKSRPETHQGSSHLLMMRLKPDQETGAHGLPLKGCVIQTPVSPDTFKIPAELFLYHERINAWTETVS
ncbi:MAG: hypothetical protein HDR24_13330 [Lachnospiraceae bacterium]|nr:hypothetical protein [Lachnospiraceae bacterium]